MLKNDIFVLSSRSKRTEKKIDTESKAMTSSYFQTVVLKSSA